MINRNINQQKEFNIRAKNICNYIKKIHPSEISPNNSISTDLVENYTNTPEAFLEWGARLMDQNYAAVGAEFIKEACNNAHYDNKPSIIYNKSIKILSKHGFPKKRIDILEKAIEEAPEDLYFNTSLAKLYIDSDETKKAIKLIENLHKTKSDNFTFNTLAKAYVEHGSPGAALTILKGQASLDDFGFDIMADAYIHQGYPENACKLMKNKYSMDGEIRSGSLHVWSNACVMSKNRNDFDKIKNKIDNEMLRDYLDAKLCYFENDMSKMQSILTPYINSKNPRNNMVCLYLLSITDDSPMHNIIKDIYGDNNYDYFMKNREEWINNPNLPSVYQDFKTEITPIYENGGLPVNQSERSKLGLGRELPVSSLNNMWQPR